jgi:REP element-mobilizing transposase RayT
LPLLGRIVNDSVELSEAGKMTDERFLNIAKESDINIDKYVIMPNHIHAIVTISSQGAMQDTGTTQGSFPTVSQMIQRFKTITTKLYIDGVKTGMFPPFDKKIWQKSFFDHIIRNEKSYLEVWQYIDENPLKWKEDEFSNEM